MLYCVLFLNFSVYCAVFFVLVAALQGIYRVVDRHSVRSPTANPAERAEMGGRDVPLGGRARVLGSFQGAEEEGGRKRERERARERGFSLEEGKTRKTIWPEAFILFVHLFVHVFCSVPFSV